MKAFYSLLANSLVSIVGTTLVWFSLSIWAYLETRSVVVTSILSSGFLLGMIATSIYFGSIVDHHQKKNVMIWADAVSLIFFVGSFLIYTSAPVDTFRQVENPLLWVFLTITYLGFIITNLRTIALPTLPSFLVPEADRAKANGMIGTLNGVSYLVAPMLGGILISLSGMFWILLTVICLRVATILHLLSLSITEDHLEDHALHEPNSKKVDFKGTFKIILSVPGLFPLMIFNCFNNFLGGVFMPLVDPYGLSLVEQKYWGFISGILSIGFIASGLIIAKVGLGKNPVKTLLMVNVYLWILTIFFTIQPSLILLMLGMFFYFFGVPYIESAEQTIIQKVVPKKRQGRVFGFAQSIEQMASPISSLIVGPLTQFIFIPFMTTGKGAAAIGSWFGVGDSRGIALAFTVTGIIGLIATIAALNSKHYHLLSSYYQHGK